MPRANRVEYFHLKGSTLAGILVLGALYYTSTFNYLLFHSLVEVFSIVVACGIFIIGWNSRQYIKSNYLIFISIAYLFIGFLDLLHTLAYKGMGIFTDYDFYANQLWIATRYMESLALLTAFYYVDEKRKLNAKALFATFTIVTSLIVLSIFVWKIFPECFVNNQGLTMFKKVSEYVICCILLVVLGNLYRKKSLFDSVVYRYMNISIVCTIVSELAFTFYISNYGFSNLMGHYFKIFSFYMIYKAIIETGLRRPYDMIFRQLVENQDKLREAKEVADRANRAKSDFLANMSHEIRTPLNGLLGMLQLLKMTRLENEQLNYVQLAENSGRSLLDIINDVLDLSKIEAGHLEIRKEKVYVPGLLHTVVSLFEGLAKDKGVALTSEIEPDMPSGIVVDGIRLRQIVFNLMGNAVKFTSEGRVTLRAGLQGDDRQALENGKGVLLLEVEDTGEGIPKEKQRDIFSPFSQATRSREEGAKGTGLGLSIVNKLITLMHGEISLRSAPGKGSLFSIRIPVEIRESAGSDHTDTYIKCDIPTCEGREDFEHEPHRPLNIVIADDDRVSILAARRLLENLGNHVITASNGHEVLQALDRGPVDVILLDIQMPEMDGLETTRRIRSSRARYVHVPILCLSGNAFTEDREKALAAGMNDYLTKPLDFHEVVRSIHEHVFGQDHTHEQCSE